MIWMCSRNSIGGRRAPSTGRYPVQPTLRPAAAHAASRMVPAVEGGRRALWSGLAMGSGSMDSAGRGSLSLRGSRTDPGAPCSHLTPDPVRLRAPPVGGRVRTIGTRGTWHGNTGGSGGSGLRGTGGRQGADPPISWDAASGDIGDSRGSRSRGVSTGIAAVSGGAHRPARPPAPRPCRGSRCQPGGLPHASPSMGHYSPVGCRPCYPRADGHMPGAAARPTT